MKRQIFIVIILALKTSAEKILDTIDLSLVTGVDERPGFWDNKIPDLKPGLADPRSRSRIIGGWEVEPHSHPYAVFLLSQISGNSWRCAGSIISPVAVLTAGHCLENSASTLIIAGAHNIHSIEPTQQRRTVPSSDYRIHENYNPRNLQNDIAILFIRSSPISESQEIRYSRLPYEYKDEIFAGEMVSIVGWGRTCALCHTSSVLRGVENLVITNNECSEYYASLIPNKICIQTTGRRGACPGDSGGPYTLSRAGQDNLLQVIQIGVHSYGSGGGCGFDSPSVASRLTHFLNWIDSTLKPKNH